MRLLISPTLRCVSTYLHHAMSLYNVLLGTNGPVSLSQASMSVQHYAMGGSAPFNHSGWPVEIQASQHPLMPLCALKLINCTMGVDCCVFGVAIQVSVLSVHSWGIVRGSAGPVPSSPACPNATACGPSRLVKLVYLRTPDRCTIEFALTFFTRFLVRSPS